MYDTSLLFNSLEFANFLIVYKFCNACNYKIKRRFFTKLSIIYYNFYKYIKKLKILKFSLISRILNVLEIAIGFEY